MKKLLTALLLLATLAIGMAALRPLDFYATLQGMRSVAEGRTGTFAWSDGNLVVMAWQQGARDYAFVVVRESGDIVKDLKELCNGNCADWKTFAEFGKWLEDKGFKVAPASTLPPAITLTLRSYTMLLVALGTRTLTSFWIVPIFPNLSVYPTGAVQ